VRTGSAIISLAALMLFFTAASAQSDARFVGSWETVRTIKNDSITEYSSGDAEHFWHWKFLADGSGIVSVKNRGKLTGMEITWKIESGKFVLTDTSGRKTDISGFRFAEKGTVLRIGVDEPNIIVLRKMSE
jgi:hypothetical protein